MAADPEGQVVTESPSALLERAAAKIEAWANETIRPDAVWPLIAWMRRTSRYMRRERAMLGSEKSGRALFEGKYSEAIEFALRVLDEAPADFYDEPSATPESRRRFDEAQAQSQRPQGLVEAMAAGMWEKCGEHGASRPSWDSQDDAEKAKWHGLAEVAFDAVKLTLDVWRTDLDILNARIAELEEEVDRD